MKLKSKDWIASTPNSRSKRKKPTLRKNREVTNKRLYALIKSKNFKKNIFGPKRLPICDSENRGYPPSNASVQKGI